LWCACAPSNYTRLVRPFSVHTVESSTATELEYEDGLALVHAEWVSCRSKGSNNSGTAVPCPCRQGAARGRYPTPVSAQTNSRLWPWHPHLPSHACLTNVDILPHADPYRRGLRYRVTQRHQECYNTFNPVGYTADIDACARAVASHPECSAAFERCPYNGRCSCQLRGVRPGAWRL